MIDKMGDEELLNWIETQKVIILIKDEVSRQESIGNTNTDNFNTPNDWVAYITSYAGRAADTYRNGCENQSFRENLIKVAALCVSALKTSYKE